MFAILCFLFSFSASAATGEIPIKTLFIQFINFVPFALLLVYFTRKPLSFFFSKRRQDFVEMEDRAKEYELAKQKEHALEEQKLNDIKSQQQSVAHRAAEEGERYRGKKAAGA